MSDWTYAPPPGPLVVLHHDRDLIAIDKPSGLLSVPGRGAHLADCASSRVEALLGAPVYPVHRLDMDTSGVLLLATRRKAERALKRQFQERAVQKRYLARAWGHLESADGVIDQPLRRLVGQPRSVVDPDGRPARTQWRVLQRDAASSLVELRPQTGRSHQLRVHLLWLGHPILGDRFYAEGAALAASPRLLLHAAWLRLHHPWTGEALEICAPAPSALTARSAPSDPVAPR